MVPEPTHYILWIPSEKTLPIWCSTLAPFAGIHRRTTQAKNKNYVHSRTRCSTYCGNGCALAAGSCPHDNAGSGCVCRRLRRLGLHLSRDPHRGRIVSPLDPGGAAPRCRGDSSLPHFSLQDRDPTERHTLAHRYCRRSIAAIRWKWRSKLGRTDCTLWNYGTPGGDSVALVCGPFPE